MQQAQMAFHDERHADVVGIVKQAQRHFPNDAKLAEASAHAFAALGQTGKAVEAFRKAVRLAPHSATATFNLGSALLKAGQYADAVSSLRRAAELQPDHTGALNNLGNALRFAGRPKEAVAPLREALRLAGSSPDIQFNLGRVLLATKQYQEAAALFAAAIQARPSEAVAHAMLGQALAGMGQADAALESYGQAIAARPDDPAPRADRGRTLLRFGRIGDALGDLAELASKYPGSADALGAYAQALAASGALDESIRVNRQALDLDPSNREIRFALGLALLTRGDLASGWPEFAHRDTAQAYATDLRTPRFDGRARLGRVVMVFDEQGFGDAIQMARFIPLLATRVKPVLRVRPPLVRLLRSLGGDPDVVASTGPVPFHDAHCPIMDLPGLLDIDLSNIPATVPYLSAPPDDARVWAERVATLPGCKVGIVWAGNPGYLADNTRSVPREMLTPLADVPGVSFVSLQKGASPPFPMADWTGDLDDLASAAALIGALDLVIAVDTMAAHLAGALGRPVWLLNRFDTDWRWMLHRDDSPWYPTMRIIRQPTPGDWTSVIATVRDRLGRFR
jgi:Flp pilus assembly protein TadD